MLNSESANMMYFEKYHSVIGKDSCGIKLAISSIPIALIFKFKFENCNPISTTTQLLNTFFALLIALMQWSEQGKHFKCNFRIKTKIIKLKLLPRFNNARAFILFSPELEISMMVVANKDVFSSRKFSVPTQKVARVANALFRENEKKNQTYYFQSW